MVKLGSSAFVTELSIAFMMFLGNYVFISHLGEDGVAEKGGEGEKTYSAEECCSVHQTEGLFDP